MESRPKLAVVLVASLLTTGLVVLARPGLPEVGVRVKAAKKIQLRLLGTKLGPVTAEPDSWSPWLVLPPDDLAAIASRAGSKKGPLVLGLNVSPIGSSLDLDLELRAGDKVTSAKASLFGPHVGLMLDREKPALETMAQYNRRYWRALDDLPAAPQLKTITLVDRFIGGSDDRLEWQDGIRGLAKVGINAIMLPPGKTQRELLLESGVKKSAWAVYCPPGYAFDFNEKETSDAALAAWAEKTAKPYHDAGYRGDDLAFFALADEPGWYYPNMLDQVAKDPKALERFHAYLRAQKLAPGDVGAESWDAVKPIGRSAVAGKESVPLATRRLYYWTCRFYPWVSCSLYARSTRALEKAFGAEVPISVNFNFFAGRFFVPGPVANNPDKKSPDAAMGGHDWLEFGRERGCTALWTEDWFSDAQGWQWSTYAARLRSAARKSGVRWGGYVIGRTSGSIEEGLTRKALALVGHGAKLLKFYCFGPDYNFPGNCYSESPAVLREIARTAKLLAGAEDVLGPGAPPPAEVAILSPQSSQPWDQLDKVRASGLSDATNTNLNGNCAPYTAEAADLSLALQHANVPVDVLDELDLLEGTLERYRVLYVVGPHLPAECQAAVAAWVKRGGVLSLSADAATRDRYDAPCSTLRDLEGTAPVATFTDGPVKGSERSVAKGTVFHFAANPGVAYWSSARKDAHGWPVGFSEAARRAILRPVERAHVKSPVSTSVPLVEAPLLVAATGRAVTLLNWTGEALPAVTVTVETGSGAVSTVTSAARGALAFERVAGGVRFTLPLAGADVVSIR